MPLSLVVALRIRNVSLLILRGAPLAVQIYAMASTGTISKTSFVSHTDALLRSIGTTGANTFTGIGAEAERQLFELMFTASATSKR